MSEARGGGWEGLSHARGQGPRPEGQPTSKEQWLCWCRRAERSYSTFKVRRDSGEEIPLVQGKRNPSKMVGVAGGIRGQTH